MEPRVLVLFWPTLKWQLSSRCPRLSLFFSNPNNVKSPPPAVETLHSSFSERADVRSDIWESTLSGELHRKRKTMECVYIYILFFFTTGKWVHSSRLHITGKKKGNQEQNMRGGLKESIEWSAPFSTAMIRLLSPSSGETVFQAIRAAGGGVSKTTSLQWFPRLLLYLHWERSMGECRKHSRVSRPGAACLSA